MNAKHITQILRQPHISEKSTDVADKHRQIVFKVAANATKKSIKAAVEQFFNVKVTAVQTSHVKGKTKSFRQTNGKRKDWKKAYVCLAEGYDIDFAETN